MQRYATARAAASARVTGKLSPQSSRGCPHHDECRGGWERVRMGCRSCGRVMHGSLGSTVAFHHERHENTGEAKGRHHPRRKCQAGGERLRSCLARCGSVCRHRGVDRRRQGRCHRRADVAGHVGNAGRRSDLVCGNGSCRCGGRRPIGQPHPHSDCDQGQQKCQIAPGWLDETDCCESTGSDGESHADDLAATEAGGEARHEWCNQDQANRRG